MSIRTRKLKSGRTAYDVELRRPDGTKYGRRFYVKQQAKDWQAEQIADRARDTWADPVAGRIRLRDYAQEWLDNRQLAPRSREVYDSQLKHILATFGDHSLNAITKRAVRSWNTKMRREVSPLQAAKCYRLLMAMLNTAVEDEVIGKNRCRIKGAAQERSGERPLVPLDKTLELAATIDRRYRAAGAPRRRLRAAPRRAVGPHPRRRRPGAREAARRQAEAGAVQRAGHRGPPAQDRGRKAPGQHPDHRRR